tara:strand:+ start:21846 stop:29309 length:7464 start_codon:yes stop_codon:yes gene_type:complete
MLISQCFHAMFGRPHRLLRGAGIRRRSHFEHIRRKPAAAVADCTSGGADVACITEVEQLEDRTLLAAFNVTQLTDFGDDVLDHRQQLSISGDGSRVVFSSRLKQNGENPDGGYEVFLLDTSTGDIDQLTDTPAPPFNSFLPAIDPLPVISDDGSRIAYVAFEDVLEEDPANPSQDKLVRRSFLAVRDLNTGTTTRLTDNLDPSLHRFYELAINSDGTHVAFASDANLTGNNSSEVRVVYLMSAGGGPTTQVPGLSPEIGFDIAISGDGNSVAFRTDADLVGNNPDRHRQVFLFDAGTGQTIQVTDAEFDINADVVSVNAGGTEVLVSMQDKPVYETERVEIDGSVTTFRNVSREVIQFDIPNETRTVLTETPDQQFRGGGSNLVPFQASASADGTQVTFLQGSNTGPGRLSFFDTSDGVEQDVPFLPVTGVLAGVGVSDPVSFATVSGDGKHIVFSAFTGSFPDETLEIFFASIAPTIDISDFYGIDATRNLRLDYSLNEDIATSGQFRFFASLEAFGDTHVRGVGADLGTLTVSPTAISGSGGSMQLIGESGAGTALDAGNHTLEFDVDLVPGLAAALANSDVQQIFVEFDQESTVTSSEHIAAVSEAEDDEVAPFRGFFRADGSDVLVVRTGPESQGATIGNGDASGTLALSIDYDTGDGPLMKSATVDIQTNPIMSVLVLASDSNDFIHVESDVVIDTVIRARDGINLVAGGSGDDDIKGGDNLDVLIGEGFGLDATGLRAFLESLSDAPERELQLASISLAAVGEGNDTIDGAGGFDILMGGPGTDRIFSRDGGGILLGDSIRAEVALNVNFVPLFNADSFSAAQDALVSALNFSAGVVLDGAGNDTIFGGSGLELVIAGAGDDLFEAIDPDGFSGGLVDVIFGNDGSDDINGERTDFTITFGGADDDVIVGGRKGSFQMGNGGHDVLRGQSFVDVLIGDTLDFDGNTNVGAALRGLSEGRFSLGIDIRTVDEDQAGDDVLIGSGGFDVLLGGSGDDILEGGTGVGLLFGDSFDLSASLNLDFGELEASSQGESEDVSQSKSSGFFAKAAALLSANSSFELKGTGNDHITGSYGFGVLGIDVAFGGAGNDRMFTGGGVVDVFFGNDGDDTIKGGGSYTQLDQLLSQAGSVTGLRELANRRRAGEELRVSALQASSFSILVGGHGSDVLQASSDDFQLDTQTVGSILIGDTFEFSEIPTTPLGILNTVTFEFINIVNVVKLPVFFQFKTGLVQKGDGDDVLQGALNGVNVLVGGDGNDQLTGHGFFDVLMGDSLNLGAEIKLDFRGLSLSKSLEENFEAIDTTFELPGLAGTGDDTIQGSDGFTLAIGGDGADDIRDEGGSLDLLFGNDGNDTIQGGSGFNVIVGGRDSNTGPPGDGVRIGDILNGGLNATNVILGDTFQFGTKSLFSLDALRDGDVHVTAALAPAGMGDDIINGGRNLNLIIGGHGDDFITGGDGTNVILGDALLIGDVYNFSSNFLEAAKNLLFGDPNAALNSALAALGLTGAGNDEIRGGNDTDVLLGGGGDDVLLGGGNGIREFDFLVGGDGNDTVNGEAGDDIVFGGPGDDELRGGTGNDHLESEGGDDRFFGEAGDDRIFGGAGNDSLYGGSGNDELFGEDADDLLDGGTGQNVITDNQGNNTIVSTPAPITGFQTIGDGVGGLPENTLEPYDGFGGSTAGIGDIDGDGIPDVAVGSYDSVRILLLNDDGTVKASTKIADGEGGLPDDVLNERVDSLGLQVYDQFGASIAGIGDRNGDGIPDIAVGTPALSETPVPGSIYVLYLNNDGSVKDHRRISDGVGGLPEGTVESDFRFGRAVVSLDDIDGDGFDDLAVSSGTYGPSLDVHVLRLNADGTVKANSRIADGVGGLPAGSVSSQDGFGSSLASLGDLDGDGVTDLAVGAPRESNGGGYYAGAVHLLFLNTDGSVKSNAKIADGTSGLTTGTVSSRDNFGNAISFLPDRDGNGVPELAVGAKSAGDGTVHVLSLNGDGTIQSSFTIGDASGETPDGLGSPGFGTAVAAIGDVNGDGAADLAVTSVSFSSPNELNVIFLGASTSQSATITLQNEGRNLELLGDGPELVLRDQQGAELIRLDTSRLEEFEIIGSEGPDAVTILGTGLVTTPVLFNGNGDDDRFDASSATVAVTLNGGAGNDTLLGGNDDDVLSGGAGTNELSGGGGTDTLRVTGNSRLQVSVTTASGAGADTHSGFEQAILVAGAGNNRLDATEAPFPVTLLGNGGNDTLLGSSMADYLVGGDGIDFVEITGTNIVLTDASDSDLNSDILNSVEGVQLTATGPGSVIDASGYTRGPLTIIGSFGNDTLTGGTGDDLIFAGSGNDIVNGGAGNDLIAGNSGRDSLYGGTGNDTILGGRGRDNIDGGDNDDSLFGGGGRDSIDGVDGADTIFGGSGPDNIAGGLGADMLNGVERDDTFDAIVGRDTLLGGQRPSGRSAPVSTDQEPAGKEEMPIFQNSLAYIEKIDEAFGKLVLPALLEF